MLVPNLLLLLLILLPLSLAKREPNPSTKARQSKVPQATREACLGNLNASMALIKKENTAGALHILSTLLLLLEADTEAAVFVHDLAVERDKKTLPPLAKLYLDGADCNGLGDIFYIAAVSIKRLKDKGISYGASLETHLTMITLLSDSGLPHIAEVHLTKAFGMEMREATLKFRAALMTPAVFESKKHLVATRALLEDRLNALSNDTNLHLDKLDEFVMSPTFYFIYQGYSDAEYLTTLHDAYAKAYPMLHQYSESMPKFPPVAVDGSEISESKTDTSSTTLRVGFVSSHFRRHSICKLYCGIIQDLSKTTHISSTGRSTSFQVYVFSGQDESREDGMTNKLKSSAHRFIRLARYTIPSRQEVTKRNIDVLIYLDVGMEPSTTVWAASKLAPIQMCTWGHPSTTGLRSMDYFISSDIFHLDMDPRYKTEDTFLEQLVRLPSSLGIMFNRPSLPLTPEVTTDDLVFRKESYLQGVNELSSKKPANMTFSLFPPPANITTLIEHRTNNHPLVLIPQHLPKFHPDFDVVLKEILGNVSNSRIIITYDPKNSLWRRTLEQRWKREAGISSEDVRTRILWMESLSPSQYLATLSLGDVMIDPYPFGGGVTTLEALAVCTPVVSLPYLQNVPALSAGMLRTMSEGASDPVHNKNVYSSVDDLIHGAIELLTDQQAAIATRSAICRDAEKLFSMSTSSKNAVKEWAELIANAASPSQKMN